MNFNYIFHIIKNMNVIRTNRLYIKPYIDKYMNNIIKFYTDSDLHKYQDICESDEEVIQIINSMNNYFNQSYGIMGIKCIFLTDNTLIGMIPIFPNLYLEFGITIDYNYQNQGLATEALQLLVNHYQQISFLPSIYQGFYSQTNCNNFKCQHVLNNAGFIFNNIKLTCCDKHADYTYILEIKN